MFYEIFGTASRTIRSLSGRCLDDLNQGKELIMNIKMLCMGAMALSMVTGAALAGGTKGTSALDDPAKMSPFFTDAGMKTMRPMEEFKVAWMAMNQDDRAG